MQSNGYHAAAHNAATSPSGDQAALPRVFLTGSEHLHPAQIDHGGFGDNAVLKCASEALSFARQRLTSIDELRANPHPEDKPATHARKIKEAISDFSGVWDKQWDGHKAALEAELKRVETELTHHANLKPVERHFDAITSTFYHMKPDERAKAISDLVAQRDFPTLATLIDAPLLITKLTPEQREGIRERVFREVDPKGVALRDHLEVALRKWENAGHASIRVCLRLAEGTDRFAARTQSAERIAQKVRTSR